MYCIDFFRKILLSQYTLVGFSTFIGAIAAFALGWIKELIYNKISEREELIIYFYNLHFAIRNFAIFINNVNLLKTWLQDINIEENIKNKNIPIDNIDFNFNEQKLCFICSKNSNLYENIIQLKTELKILYESAVQYNEIHNAELLDEINSNALSLCPKILSTIKNVNKYLIKYCKQKTLITGQIEININKLDSFFENSIKVIKENILNKDTNLKVLNAIKEIESIRKGWEIEI